MTKAALLTTEQDYLQRMSLAYNDAWKGYHDGTLHVRDLLTICEEHRVMPGTILHMCQSAHETLTGLKATDDNA